MPFSAPHQPNSTTLHPPFHPFAFLTLSSPNQWRLLLKFPSFSAHDETSDELSSFIPISDPTIKNSIFSFASPAAKEVLKAEAASSLTHHKVPAINWKETTLSLFIKADVPGFKKEQVKLEVEDGHVLSISGVRKKEDVDDVVKMYHAERISGKFWRRFHVPENAKKEEIKDVMEDGVLTITDPKVEVPKKLVKSVQITVP